jgi:hypothetical protein
MESRSIASLAELEVLARSLVAEYRLAHPSPNPYTSPLLFRGHARASWNLETTLERAGKVKLPMQEYVRYLSKVKPAIEAYTGRQFQFHYKNKPGEGRWFALSDVSFLDGQYEFMVYLRHHGFPSPLLDWTRSLYVALFFACAGPVSEESGAIYLYVEDIGFGKGGMVGAPEIATFGQYVTAHPRHFVQQAQYTGCIARQEDEWCFHPHEDAFGRASPTHDRLVKVEIPSELRRDILRRLDEMNINAYSLFGTEEALMQTLAARELEID